MSRSFTVLAIGVGAIVFIPSSACGQTGLRSTRPTVRPGIPKIASGTFNQCKITLSGAQTGSMGCNVTAVESSTDSSSTVAITGTGFPIAVVAFVIPGAELAKQQYDGANAKQFAATVNATAGVTAYVWECSAGLASSAPPQGNGVMQINSISTLTASPDGSAKVVQVHGSLNASCPAAQNTGVTGTVSINVSF